MNESLLSADWLLESALGGGLILLVTCFLMHRSRQPARRQYLGEWGLVAALALTVLSLRTPWLTVPILKDDGSAAVEPMATASEVKTTVEPQIDEVQDLTQSEHPIYATFVPVEMEHFELVRTQERQVQSADWSIALPTWARWVAPFYALVAFLLMGRWLLGYVALGQLLREAKPAQGRVAQLFARMARNRRPRLLVSSRLSSPISCGLLRPTVVVPTCLCRPEKEQTLRWVFAHELTHLERRDAWTCLLFALGQAVYFYLPWFWWLRRQVRLSQEFIADAAAVEQGGDAEDYAQLLLNLRKRPAVPVSATGVLGNSSDLFRRVTMLLQGRLQVEKHCPRTWGLAAATSLMVLGVLLSGISLRAQAAAPQDAKKKFVVVEVDEDDDKDIKKKDGEKKKDPTKKDQVEKKRFVEFPKIELPEVDDILRNLPKELSKDQIEQLRKDLMQAKEHIKAAREQFEKARPNIEEDVRKRVRGALEQAQVGRQVLFAGGGEGRLGVVVEKPSTALAEQLDMPKDQGLVVTSVRADSPAAKAGVRVNDILLEVDGKAVPSDSGGLLNMLNEIKTDTPISIQVLRKGRKQTLRGLTLPEAKKRAVIRSVGDVTVIPGEGGKQGVARILSKIGDSKGVSVSITRNDDRLTAKHQEGSVSISVTGTVKDGKVSVDQMEAVLVLATMMQRYRLELAPEFKLDLLPSVTLRPKYGMKMVVRGRAKS